MSTYGRPMHPHGVPQNSKINRQSKFLAQLGCSPTEGGGEFVERSPHTTLTTSTSDCKLPILSVPVSVDHDSAVKITFERSSVLAKGGEKASWISSKDSLRCLKNLLMFARTGETERLSIGTIQRDSDMQLTAVLPGCIVLKV